MTEDTDIRRYAAAWRAALRELDADQAYENATEGFRRFGVESYSEKVVVPSLIEIGKEWERGDVSLAEVYLTGKISSSIINDLTPAESRDSRVAVCVLEDHHTLGKSLVLISLRSAGIAATDLGVVNVEEAVEQLRSGDIQLLFVSTLMLRSALLVEELVNRLRAEGIKTPIVVGGAPFRMDPSLAQKVKADAGGISAADSIGLVNRFLGEAV